MKNVKTILRYILAVILTFSIVIFLVVNIAKSTILNKTFVLNKLDQTAYYTKIYAYIKENFKNHIQQSGLEETILDDLITQEQVENDTKKVITNMYNNVHEEISTEELKQRLTSKIDEQIKGTLVTTEQKQEINSFINDICNEYLVGIAHFGSEKSIYNVYDKVDNIVELLNKVSLITTSISTIALIIICKNRFYKFFVFSGISCLSSGLFFTIANIFINSKINIQAITVLNDAFSFTLREVLDTIIKMISEKGIILFITGLLLIAISLFIHNFFKYKNLKEN